MSARRWDDDKRGHGVADGRRLRATRRGGRSATYIRQRRDEPVGDVDQPIGGDRLFYEVATGMLGPDTRYAPHGHVLVLRVNGAFGGA